MNGYQTQIESLKKENIQLTEDKKTLTEEKGTLTEEKKGLEETKKGLEKKVELASVLHASNIRMEAMHNAHTLFGKEKEKETEKASKTDFIRMRFDLDDNRISESGEKEIYICVFDPSGKVIAPSSLKFHLADNSEMSYTLSKTIPCKQGEKVKDIIAEWHPATMPGKGTYKVDIYHMGYKIGGERVTLH